MNFSHMYIKVNEFNAFKDNLPKDLRISRIIELVSKEKSTERKG